MRRNTVVTEDDLIMFESVNNFYSCKRLFPLMHSEKLVDEPALISVPVFPKRSTYIEKVAKISPFLAGEHIRKERKIFSRATKSFVD